MSKRSFSNKYHSFLSDRGLFIVLFIIVLIALGVWLGFASKNDPKGESQYSAVYLTTGDIYFGKFSRFPAPHMTDAWHLDRGMDKNNNPQIGLSEVSKAFWAPAEDMYFNRNQIVFWTELRNDSPLINVLSGKQQLTSADQGPSAAGVNQPPAGPVTQQPAQTPRQSTSTP